MKEINISNFHSKKDNMVKKWWIGIDSQPVTVTTSEELETGISYSREVQVAIGDAIVTFQCDSDNQVQFLDKDKFKESVQKDCREIMLKLLDLDSDARYDLFHNDDVSDILMKYSFEEIRTKIEEVTKTFEIGDEVEFRPEGARGKLRGVVCGISKNRVWVFRSLQDMSDVPYISVYKKTSFAYKKTSFAYKSMQKTGNHYEGFKEIFY